MKTKLAFCLAVISIWTANSNAQLFDDFNDGTLNTSLWSTFSTSFGNSSLSESGGNLRFGNGSAIITTSQFVNPTISGRFRISGWEYDRFKVLIRSDGTMIDTHWQSRIGGLGIQFTSGSNPDYGSSQTLQLWNFRTGTLLTSAAPTISMNTWYDFTIADSGSQISVFLNNSATPTLTYVTTTSYGNYVEFGNREQAAGSWPPPYYLDLDFVSVVPEPNTLTLFSAGIAGILFVRRKCCV